jgi:hypothetical protein
MLLKRQKPIARSGRAWCPGGRTIAKPPFLAASIAVPAASSAASQLVSEAIVSPSSHWDRLSERICRT